MLGGARLSGARARMGDMFSRVMNAWARAHPSRRGLLLAILIAVLLSALHARADMQFAEARAYDLLSTLWPARPPAPGAVIVAIDEPSFAEVGARWPWPRALHARLVKQLRAAGARVVALDVLFAEPADPEDDVVLAQALGPDNVLAAVQDVIHMDQGTQVSRVNPLPMLLAGGARSGDTSVNLDGDGVMRRAPPIEESFVEAVLSARGGTTKKSPPGALLQFFGGARTYPTVSYYQALDPKRFLPAGFFKDRTVLVGLSLKAAPATDSSATDAFQTPFTIHDATMTAGIELHATILDNLSYRLWTTPVSQSVLSLAVFFSAWIGAGFRTGQTALRQAAEPALMVIAVIIGSYLLLRYERLWLAPVAPALAVVGAYGARVGFDYARERRLRAQISNAFARYVAPALVEELMKDPKALQLGGERREITVLFCDVRGFTGLSERLKDDPIKLMTIINRLLDALSAEVLATRGTIDKYMGDCVMAFWNAPVPVADHPHAAVATAVRMGETVARLNTQLAAEDPTHVPLAVGVGVSTGVCVVGNIGSRWRYDYSVLGDTVNLASRLEGLTKEFGVGVIVGPETAERVSDRYDVQKLAHIAVRGRSEKLPVFAVSERRETSATILEQTP
ncbi:adenylate/guanylate cyclase domain-containing protein (plasmid) [Methylocystis iwaonis]|uniref:Adenylate/guanylate cyclase domain-containing protein n=2 Tax=Methylocystis iwaonis TaxID=2885079 RepID=A0ABN6VK13_9HYPH|nr:adenylate/guanylate cyclase domain-containing protein [Methylocystis iwaonis]